MIGRRVSFVGPTRRYEFFGTVTGWNAPYFVIWVGRWPALVRATEITGIEE